ncbi:MAG: pyrroline-5-carboxylate reductase [Dehalococcoidia bacterium]|jgi:pyrroline-5-carboxylate reductase
MMKVGFIGGGKMAEALIGALLVNGVSSPEELAVGEPLPGRRQTLAEEYRVQVTADNRKAIAGAELVVVAVKPNQFSTVAANLQGQLRVQQTAVSIMAGITLQRLRESLRHERVVRVMPNPPAQIGEGMSVWTATREVDETARQKVQQLLQAAGKELYVEEERFIDMATAVSGSGAGFVFLLIEAFIDGAVHIGVPRDMARELVVQTFAGSAALVDRSDKTPGDLRAMTTTPGGTTAEGLLVLEEAGIRAAVTEALIAAFEKSKALGG